MKSDRIIFKSLMMITQIGLSMITPIFICVFIGLKMDGWLKTEYWFIIWLILGIMSAFRSVYMLTRKFYSSSLKHEQEEQEYFEELKKNRKDNK